MNLLGLSKESVLETLNDNKASQELKKLTEYCYFKGSRFYTIEKGLEEINLTLIYYCNKYDVILTNYDDIIFERKINFNNYSRMLDLQGIIILIEMFFSKYYKCYPMEQYKKYLENT